MVNRYLPRPKRKEGVNLLSGAEAEQDALAPEAPDDGAEEEVPREIISFFRPNITFAMVDDFTTYPQNAIPPHVRVPVQAVLTPNLHRTNLEGILPPSMLNYNSWVSDVDL